MPFIAEHNPMTITGITILDHQYYYYYDYYYGIYSLKSFYWSKHISGIKTKNLNLDFRTNAC